MFTYSEHIFFSENVFEIFFEKKKIIIFYSCPAVAHGKRVNIIAEETVITRFTNWRIFVQIAAKRQYTAPIKY